jgi:hypothetical protein
MYPCCTAILSPVATVWDFAQKISAKTERDRLFFATRRRVHASLHRRGANGRDYWGIGPLVIVLCSLEHHVTFAVDGLQCDDLSWLLAWHSK